VARELGISRKILHDWIKAWKARVSDQPQSPRCPHSLSTTAVLGRTNGGAGDCVGQMPLSVQLFDLHLSEDMLACADHPPIV
jgi:hypothetical protein